MFNSIEELISYLKANVKNKKFINSIRNDNNNKFTNKSFAGYYYHVFHFKSLNVVVKVLREDGFGKQIHPAKNMKIGRRGDYLYPIWQSRCGTFIVQPLVDTSKNAVKKAEEYFMYNYADDYFPDFHDDNIGMYNGQPVCFDWDNKEQ